MFKQKSKNKNSQLTENKLELICFRVKFSLDHSPVQRRGFIILEVTVTACECVSFINESMNNEQREREREIKKSEL